MVSRGGSLDLKRPKRSCWRVAGEADLEDAQLLARRFFMAALLSHLECGSGGAVCGSEFDQFDAWAIGAILLVI